MNSKFDKLFNRIISEAAVPPEGSEQYANKYDEEQKQVVMDKAKECGFKFDDTKINLLCAEIYENYGFDPLHVKNMPHDKFTGIVKEMLKNWYDNEDEVDPIPEIEQSKKVNRKKKVIKESYRNKIRRRHMIKENSTISEGKKRIPLDGPVDSLPGISNKQETEDGIITYDLEDSEEAMDSLRKIVNAYLGSTRIPWDLVLKNDAIDPEQNRERVWKLWQRYNGSTKKIAFKDNKLIALSASYNEKEMWWDTWDRSYNSLEDLIANI